MSMENQPGTRGRRILVADDNPVNREMAVRMLEQLGCRADAAADGMEALAAHRAGRYDLILMDCEMPQLDGYAATRRLRAEENGVRTPVLALTAHTGTEQEEQCREAGMDALLAKPLRPQMLREALAHWLDCPQAMPQAAMPSAADEIEAVRAMFGSDFHALALFYLQDGPPRLTALRQAHENSDPALLARIAHALGGSSASIGASGLANLCRELELRARANAVGDFPARLAAIENEYRRVSGKLQPLQAE